MFSDRSILQIYIFEIKECLGICSQEGRVGTEHQNEGVFKTP